MAREKGLHRRRDSRFWWVKVVLPDGRCIRQSTGTQDRQEAEALLVRLKADAFREKELGVKPQHSWQEAAVRYLALKANLRSIADVRRIFVKLDPHLGALHLHQITGDVIWKVIEAEGKKGNKPATVNRYLCVIRALLRMARDEWQWIDSFPKIRLLPGEVERDRWLTREEAAKLLSYCPPHLDALVRFALATGCRASEIKGLEWSRVDLERGTAWLNQTKNGTPRGVPLNADAVAVLGAERGNHDRFCFTYQGKPISWEVTNSAWHSALRKASIKDFRFHDLRHTWASWHRQAGTSCDELKDLGGWKSRVMVDRYAKYATEHLAVAAARIEGERTGNVIPVTFSSRSTAKRA